MELGTADSSRKRGTVCSHQRHTKLPIAVQSFSRIYLRQAPDLPYLSASMAASISAATQTTRLRITNTMIRKLKSGEYRLYSRKKNAKTGRRRNLGTFPSRERAEAHERAVQYFKRH